MYVDYEFYSQTYHGEVPREKFERLNIQAQAIIDKYTFNRIKEANYNVKLAVCELIDYLYELENKGGNEIASEKVGTYSVTYAIPSAEIDLVKRKQRDIVRKWLGHTGLMYRGVR